MSPNRPAAKKQALKRLIDRHEMSIRELQSKLSANKGKFRQLAEEQATLKVQIATELEILRDLRPQQKETK